MVVGRLLSFSEDNFSGAMLNFRWVYKVEKDFDTRMLGLIVAGHWVRRSTQKKK